MKKPFFYGIFMGLAVFFALLGVWTALPMPASKPNILGYVSHCTWTPWSTLILLALAGLSCKLRAVFFKTKT